MSSYASVKSLHQSLPAFEPLVSTAALPPIALLALLGFFALIFLFTTLNRSKIPLAEITTVLAASSLAGIGVVALFCTVGVNV
ncbi:uncharacterized protein L203_102974 [Cryptococcus depauperatus CBS 7841]|uniref:Dolichyl-diphosphooligosaccharide-protein glycosyltransferase subunit OST5 n=1 Tax=Cryptococcus depauperatus CBS 7841 TaxID=1295531 RepID=A0A1E3IQ34_9TREE|nr:hypothetical protein L203_01759 [Cryptococcus depauperatus CBS 7841]